MDEKICFRLGENICKHVSNKGVVPRLIKCQNSTVKTQRIQWAKDVNRHFTKKNVQIAYMHMKRCSVSLAIREMQKVKPQSDITLHLFECLKQKSNAKCW